MGTEKLLVPLSLKGEGKFLSLRIWEQRNYLFHSPSKERGNSCPFEYENREITCSTLPQRRGEILVPSNMVTVKLFIPLSPKGGEGSG
jgi:hypothetical protein